MAPTPGTVIAGKYLVERVLGEGGMGCVVAAKHLELGQRVALKFLHAELARNAEVVVRFLREGQAAAQIQSEHVARVSDVGRLEDGSPYLVLEYLEGKDLSQIVHAEGPLPPDTAIDYLLQACEAIAEAHAVGIVHRDLKPANVFLTRRRDGAACAKVLDFGISKITTLDSQRQALTRTHGMMGSPLYMSPEQLRSARDVDARTDVWALGVTLFELLTGTQPFAGDDVPSLTLKIALEPPRALRSIRPELPAELESIILRCLEKDPERRYRNVAELALALRPLAPTHCTGSIERIARTLGAAVVEPTQLAPLATARTMRGGGTTAPASVDVVVHPAGRPRVLPWIVLAAALALGGAGWFVARARVPERSPAAPIPVVVVEPSVTKAEVVPVTPPSAETSAATPSPPPVAGKAQPPNGATKTSKSVPKLPGSIDVPRPSATPMPSPVLPKPTAGGAFNKEYD